MQRPRFLALITNIEMVKRIIQIVMRIIQLVMRINQIVMIIIQIVMKIIQFVIKIVQIVTIIIQIVMRIQFVHNHYYNFYSPRTKFIPVIYFLIDHH